MDRIELKKAIEEFDEKFFSGYFETETAESEGLRDLENLVPNTYIADLLFQMEMNVEEIVDEVLIQKGIYDAGGEEAFEKYLYEFAVKILENADSPEINKRYAFSLIYRRDKALALEYGHKIWPDEYPPV